MFLFFKPHSECPIDAFITHTDPQPSTSSTKKHGFSSIKDIVLGDNRITILVQPINKNVSSFHRDTDPVGQNRGSRTHFYLVDSFDKVQATSWNNSEMKTRLEYGKVCNIYFNIISIIQLVEHLDISLMNVNILFINIELHDH